MFDRLMMVTLLLTTLTVFPPRQRGCRKAGPASPGDNMSDFDEISRVFRLSCDFFLTRGKFVLSRFEVVRKYVACGYVRTNLYFRLVANFCYCD